jgi:hypothetical protein
LNYRTCMSCGITDCLVCTSINRTQSTTCIQCALAFYLLDNLCLSCGIKDCNYCQPINNRIQCTKCQSPLFISNNTCLNCSLIIRGCTICNQESFNSTICLACNYPFYLNSSTSCISCSDAVANCRDCSQ